MWRASRGRAEPRTLRRAAPRSADRVALREVAREPVRRHRLRESLVVRPTISPISPRFISCTSTPSTSALNGGSSLCSMKPYACADCCVPTIARSAGFAASWRTPASSTSSIIYATARPDSSARLTSPSSFALMICAFIFFPRSSCAAAARPSRPDSSRPSCRRARRSRGYRRACAWAGRSSRRRR